MKSLVLAEKPSVGRDLARVLNCKKKTKGYIEGDKYVVTWALGHLVTLAEPQDYDKRYKFWRLDDLPMLPEKMKLKIMNGTRTQFSTIKKLMQRSDMGELIIATDAGREGELVARWIIIKGGWKKKPIKRLWISSQTDQAIKDGFANLKPGFQYNNLFQAAVCRAEADWYIGLNVTRALTTKFDAQLNAGRVQTPTLRLIVDREEEITNFKPIDYWNINADFGKYKGLWQNNQNNSRIYKSELAEAIKRKIDNKTGVITVVETKEKKELPPLAYDLTELQRDANKRFGFSAKETLSLTQSLYERHKYVTYPRTDSRYLTTDMVNTIPDRLKRINIGPYKKHVEKILANEIKPGKRLVNNAKVSDHHAIIPTEQYVNLSNLTVNEKRIFDLVVKRFLVVLSDPYIYNSKKLITEVEGERFISRGISVKDYGWRAIAAPLKDDDESSDENAQTQNLNNLKKGDKYRVEHVRVTVHKTTPPPRYTEAKLLGAMESPGKFIEDEELRESIKAGGLGTPATRAEIIEKLIKTVYIERDGKKLIPTAKAFQLMKLVPEDLKSPELTAKWEKRLHDIANGNVKDSNFIADIRNSAKQLVQMIKQSKDSYEITNLTDVKCPVCGSPMLKLSKKMICSNRSCRSETSENGKTKTSRQQKKMQKQVEKRLLNQFGKEKKKQEETLGDLFDL